MSPDDRSRFEGADFATFSAGAAKAGIFLNDQTFEVAIAQTPQLLDVLLTILSEQGFGAKRSARITAWQFGTAVDPDQLLAMVSDIGKGRMSSKLAKKLPGLKPPDYIAAAIDFVASRV